MLKLLTEIQAEHLQTLSNKYLTTTDLAKRSIEVTQITHSKVIFWKYDPNKEGVEIIMPWFEFALRVLAPILFSAQLFKLNAIISKSILKDETDLITEYALFDSWLDEKNLRKQKDREKLEAKKEAAKKKTKQVAS